jgi:hypothetical protein
METLNTENPGYVTVNTTPNLIPYTFKYKTTNDISLTTLNANTDLNSKHGVAKSNRKYHWNYMPLSQNAPYFTTHNFLWVVKANKNMVKDPSMETKTDYTNFNKFYNVCYIS